MTKRTIVNLRAAPYSISSTQVLEYMYKWARGPLYEGVLCCCLNRYFESYVHSCLSEIGSWLCFIPGRTYTAAVSSRTSVPWYSGSERRVFMPPRESVEIVSKQRYSLLGLVLVQLY